MFVSLRSVSRGESSIYDRITQAADDFSVKDLVVSRLAPIFAPLFEGRRVTGLLRKAILTGPFV
jgi:hypothetical protein